MHVEVSEPRYGERWEVLVELELDDNHDLAWMAHDGLSDGGGGEHACSMPPISLWRAWRSMRSRSANLVDGMVGRIIDVSMFEVDTREPSA